MQNQEEGKLVLLIFLQKEVNSSRGAKIKQASVPFPQCLPLLLFPTLGNASFQKIRQGHGRKAVDEKNGYLPGQKSCGRKEKTKDYRRKGRTNA